jgi:hypothetical protein
MKTEAVDPLATTLMVWPDLLNFGARPMASILAVGLVFLMMFVGIPIPHECQVFLMIGFDAQGVRQPEDSGDSGLFRGVESGKRVVFDGGRPVV